MKRHWDGFLLVCHRVAKNVYEHYMKLLWFNKRGVAAKNIYELTLLKVQGVVSTQVVCSR